MATTNRNEPSNIWPRASRLTSHSKPHLKPVRTPPSFECFTFLLIKNEHSVKKLKIFYRNFITIVCFEGFQRVLQRSHVGCLFRTRAWSSSGGASAASGFSRSWVPHRTRVSCLRSSTDTRSRNPDRRPDPGLGRSGSSLSCPWKQMYLRKLLGNDGGASGISDGTLSVQAEFESQDRHGLLLRIMIIYYRWASGFLSECLIVWCLLFLLISLLPYLTATYQFLSNNVQRNGK